MVPRNEDLRLRDSDPETYTELSPSGRTVRSHSGNRHSKRVFAVLERNKMAVIRLGGVKGLQMVQIQHKSPSQK